MTTILHPDLPQEMRGPHSLPGVAPCDPQDWLRVDAAYADQMAYRTELIRDRRQAVLARQQGSEAACREVLEEALAVLPGLGFTVGANRVDCPDGRSVALDWSDPLSCLGHLVQEDICILQKPEGAQEHLLTAAVLCFPANWRLAEKIGRPLTAIHIPVAEYDADLARRVQRLFDGVREGRPLWRYNRLRYVDADLHQPVRRRTDGDMKYVRSERQCILRLPRTQAVVFSIHTYVIHTPD